MNIVRPSRDDLPLFRVLHELQLKAYRREADLIGFSRLPPLSESLEDLLSSPDEVFVLMRGTAVGGAVFFSKDARSVLIHKLIVDPAFFRQGIARTLLGHLLAVHNGHCVTVTTATRNLPAIKLYEAFGFRAIIVKTVEDGLELTLFQKG
jgi:ribosomal protein S18 acetylase RimI-like enzyme